MVRKQFSIRGFYFTYPAIHTDCRENGKNIKVCSVSADYDGGFIIVAREIGSGIKDTA